MTVHGPSLIFEDRSRTVSTTRNTETIEVITRNQRRRRWSLAEKSALVRRTYEAGMSVSLVARQEGVAASLLLRTASCVFTYVASLMIERGLSY
jgi:uncharacterized protein with PIN domain